MKGFGVLLIVSPEVRFAPLGTPFPSPIIRVRVDNGDSVTRRFAENEAVDLGHDVVVPEFR